MKPKYGKNTAAISECIGQNPSNNKYTSVNQSGCSTNPLCVWLDYQEASKYSALSATDKYGVGVYFDVNAGNTAKQLEYLDKIQKNQEIAANKAAKTSGTCKASAAALNYSYGSTVGAKLLSTYETNCPKEKTSKTCTVMQKGAKVPLCNWIPSDGHCEVDQDAINMSYTPALASTVLPVYTLDCPYLITKPTCTTQQKGAKSPLCKWVPP